MQNLLIMLLSALLALVLSGSAYAAMASYQGYKKCGGCHKSQKESWLETKHANAFEALKPNKSVKAKQKVKLDPKKDYTADDKCVGCHVTGYQERGGYSDRMPKTRAKYFIGVTCEECHGPGSLYRKEHRKAGREFKRSEKKTPRKVLERKGEIFDYEEACNSCHMNYEGSPWKGAKKPYTPFTPDVDKKYGFDYDKAVKEIGKDKAMHKHFKLRGVFTGKPIPKYRDEFQKDAKEPAAEEEDEGDDDEGDDEKGEKN